MSRIACKFGGSSVADHRQFIKVKAIVDANPKRSVIVPSAPGKRNHSETKLTDLLLLCHKMASVKADFTAPLEQIRNRYVEIQRELGLKTNMAEEFDKFHAEIIAGQTRDYVASRGEYFCGLLMASFLGAEFVDPADFVIIDGTGCTDPATYPRLRERLMDTSKRYVMPGYYGRDHHGHIKTFSRGGSDISGAIAARAADAEVYENWTDVSGLMMADPRIVENPRPISEVSYREIREMSYMGASVFHDEAILPVREAGIPIHIKNTNNPQEPGTMIVPKLSAETQKNTEIAGIAGKKHFSMFCIEKSLMNKEVGFAYRLLGIFESRGISFEHCPSSIDSINVIVEDGNLGDKADVILDEIQRMLQPDSLELERNMALIAVVGEEMSHTVGIAAKVFIALRNARVNIRIINQGASELNIIVGVASEDYEKAVRALYKAFVN